MAAPAVPGRYVVPLIESQRESPTSMTFRFSTRAAGFRYRSNQAIRLSLPGVEDPWGPTRTFSLSSSPSEPDILAVTCKISDTAFKQALARLAPGAEAEVFGPLGHFLYDPARPSVFIAGGIGVTPFRGMLRFAADATGAADRRLLYSARTPEELLFRSEFDSMAESSSRFRALYTVTRPSESVGDWDGPVGRIDTARIRAAAEGLERPRYFVAGLPDMVEFTIAQLRGPLAVPESDVLFEAFRGF